ncbi:MAG: hypothetical protein WB586_02960 [Chthoniobacterales bacterium]
MRSNLTEIAFILDRSGSTREVSLTLGRANPPPRMSRGGRLLAQLNSKAAEIA